LQKRGVAGDHSKKGKVAADQPRRTRHHLYWGPEWPARARDEEYLNIFWPIDQKHTHQALTAPEYRMGMHAVEGTAITAMGSLWIKKRERNTWRMGS